MFLNSVQAPKARGVKRVWVPVLCALAFVACTSTTLMGCQNTQIVVNAVWKALFGSWHWGLTGAVNGYFRKTGHFFGYGLISLLFQNAWYKTAQAFAWVVRRWLTPFAGTLAVVTTFAVSGLDELHQHFVPGRVGCIGDALIDTAGAMFINVAFWSIRARRRQNLIAAGEEA
jgi:VanZ family protein